MEAAPIPQKNCFHTLHHIPVKRHLS
uniref:Uncharacterized protein n=1 Tax=Arundo donax TaxID=35708 RepID=A0A0A8ZL48_ARUDO